MAEEVTQYRDDLEADNKRQLLSALTACVPQIVPFLETSMEGHYGQAMATAQQGQQQLSQLHAAVVTAALGRGTCRICKTGAKQHLMLYAQQEARLVPEHSTARPAPPFNCALLN